MQRSVDRKSRLEDGPYAGLTVSEIMRKDPWYVKSLLRAGVFEHTEYREHEADRLISIWPSDRDLPIGALTDHLRVADPRDYILETETD